MAATKITPDAEAKVLKQIEFYFSDSNYPKDKFLRAQAALDEQGYISLSVISSFARMKELGVTDAKELARIASKSANLEVKEDGSMIKRKNPVAQDDKLNERIVYIKGWPEGITIEEVETTLKKCGKVLCVRIRKDKEKKQKGSVFVEMSTVEEAKKLVEKKGLKYKGSELTLKSKDAYTSEKKEKRKQIKQEEDSKKKAEEAAKEKERKDKMPKGVIMKMENMPEKSTIDIIKAAFGKFGDVAYADFTEGSTEGFLRAKTPEDAKKIMAGVANTENKFELEGKTPKLTLLSEEEESQYWDKANAARAGAGPKRKNFKGKGGKQQKRRRF